MGQRTGFVGTDNRSRPHRFAGMHFADQVVCLEHAVHTQGKAEGYAHRQTFRNGNYDQGYCYHEDIQYMGDQIHDRHTR